MRLFAPGPELDLPGARSGQCLKKWEKKKKKSKFVWIRSRKAAARQQKRKMTS